MFKLMKSWPTSFFNYVFGLSPITKLFDFWYFRESLALATIFNYRCFTVSASSSKASRASSLEHISSWHSRSIFPSWTSSKLCQEFARLLRCLMKRDASWWLMNTISKEKLNKACGKNFRISFYKTSPNLTRSFWGCIFVLHSTCVNLMLV